MFSGCGSSSSTAALSCLTTACQPSSLRASVDACALSLKAELGLRTPTGREDRHRDVAVTPPLQEVISSCLAADHCGTAEDDSTQGCQATAAVLPAVAGVPISHLRRISRAANQQGSGTHLPHSGPTQQHPHLPAQPPADQHKAQSRLPSMEQRFPTPPPAYKQGNMVVIVQQGAEAAGHPQADAGGQMTLGSGLPMQYQQQQAPQQQQYQHNMQQGYVAQVAVASQLQPVQQQQPYQVQAGVVLSTQQALQQQQQAPAPQGQFQGQYAATSLQAADQQQQEQQQLQQQLHQQQVQQHQQQMQQHQQQQQQVQQQAQQQHMQQQAALSAYAAAAGQHPAQQQLAQRQGSANGAPMGRQSGSSAGGVVRQEVVLPAAGSAGVLAELDQLAAAVQVTPQPQAQQQAHAPQQQQQVPFQATPQQQQALQAQQQQFQQPAAQQAQRGYGQQGQQPRRSWEQPPDLVPLQLQQQQQQGEAAAQRTPVMVGSQGMQHQQQPQQLPQQQQQQQQALAGDGIVLVQQHPPTPQLGAQALPGQQVQVQAVQHAQLTSQLQHQQQQQQQGGPQQHVVLQGVTVSAGSSAYGTATPMQLSGHGVYDAATAPTADGQAWAGPSDVKQQPQLQPQPQQLQAPMQQALPQLLQQQPQQQAEQPVLVHNLVQLQPQLLQLQGQQAQGPALPQAQLVQLQGQQAQQQQQHGMPVSPQCWGGPLAVVAQKLPSDGVVQPGSPLTFLAGNQQVVLQPQQQAPQQQQAVDVLAALQPNGATWDAQALQMQQQQQPQAQLQPQQLQQLQLTPQQQQQAQFVDLVMVQQQQQPQQVVVVSGAMVAMPVAMPTPAVQVVPSPSPLQQQQQQVPQQQAQQPVQGGLMLPPAPRAAVAAVPQQQVQQQPQQQQQQQQVQQAQQQQAQQAQAAVPPWRQAGGEVTASGITTAAIDREIPWSELQFGHQIGEGGFGKVYYGTWRSQAVAIKVLNPQSADSAKLMSEFNREVSTMTRLPEHPNVLKLLGVCTTPPNLALVTQFCAKGSLYGLLHSPGCYLSWVQVVAMLLDAARGMEHLHANSVLHRDLKSGNLLVDQDSSVRVADFGLSRLYHGMHTMTGGLGTFQWMAPEVLANQRYSNKADIYSFGMVMWECCARQVPFEGLNGVQAALAVMSRGMRPEIPQHTPAGLAALMQDCWAPVPEQRPGFDVVVARLQDLLQQLKHAEVTATAAAAANRAAAAITAAATGAAMNASG